MPKRILIVDDERHVRTLLQSALEPLLDVGIEIALVDSGVRAIEAAAERAPDLAIIDATMPEMSGSALCRELRALEGVEELHIIMLYDKGQEGDADLWLAAGANDLLVKPFDPDAVVARVSAVLGIEPLY